MKHINNNTMSESAEWMKEQREEKARFNREARKRNTEALMELEDVFVIEQLTDFQFRINGFLDYFPTSGKFHNIRSNSRGRIDTTAGLKAGITKAMKLSSRNQHKAVTANGGPVVANVVAPVREYEIHPGKSFTLYGALVTVVRKSDHPGKVVLTDASGHQATAKIEDLQRIRK